MRHDGKGIRVMMFGTGGTAYTITKFQEYQWNLNLVKKNTKNTYKKLYKDLEKYIRRSIHTRIAWQMAHSTTYLNKRDLAAVLKKLVKDGLRMTSSGEVKYEPIPFRFAQTPKGIPFADSKKIDHLDAWVKYKAHECPLSLIVWGSRQESPIKEEYIQ